MKSFESPSNTPPNADHYPAGLKSAEEDALRGRRALNGIEPDAPVVGVALSGGGIRSATFCLGLFQALAKQRIVRRIDILSTVSGGGYFGSFLGAAFTRDEGSSDSVEGELANNHSWSVNWLRENGRFLSPNGGDNWLTAAVALRNWVTLQIVLLTFVFFLLGLASLVRADLCNSFLIGEQWRQLELFFWTHPALHIWWSPWLVLPLIPLFGLMLPTGIVYWWTQLLPLMAALRHVVGVSSRNVRAMHNTEFASRVQYGLTRLFMVGLVTTVCLFLFALVDSLGQTAYLHWAEGDFAFPSLWAMLTATGAGLFGFASKLVLVVERLLGSRKLKVPFNIVALGLASLWLLLIVVALAVVACGFAWQWDTVGDTDNYLFMSGSWKLSVAIAVTFTASWIFSRSFGFVNLSSMQQMYAARIARAYIGATNPERRRNANHSMTDLIPGDDLPLSEYAPQAHGGPLHLINVTVNETVSGKTQIERRDRKGLAMALGPVGLSVGIDWHALWAATPLRSSRLAAMQALWATDQRPVTPLCPRFETGATNPAFAFADHPKASSPRIEALALGRWTAISGAAFTTGSGSHTAVGLSLLLGLANIRLGYWWDSGINPRRHRGDARPNFLETWSHLLSFVLPVQTCLTTEFLARFHGPARRHWYLSDGGHFENTGCYELIRRRVPLIICSDAGQDPKYQFPDFADLVRKARTDFGAEIQVVRRASDQATDDPGVQFPMPKLEQIVHSELLDVIGVPEDFASLQADSEDDEESVTEKPYGRRHALLARIHYLDTNQFSWLLLIKPSLMGDETIDVIQYQRTHALFPQEPTTDQYFDEAQWESYRKLGEHIGVELFTPPIGPSAGPGATWSPSQLRPPTIVSSRLPTGSVRGVATVHDTVQPPTSVAG